MSPNGVGTLALAQWKLLQQIREVFEVFRGMGGGILAQNLAEEIDTFGDDVING